MLLMAAPTQREPRAPCELVRPARFLHILAVMMLHFICTPLAQHHDEWCTQCVKYVEAYFFAR